MTPTYFKKIFCNIVIRTIMLYESECWAVKKTTYPKKKKINIIEMRIVRWTNGNIPKDRIKN